MSTGIHNKLLSFGVAAAISIGAPALAVAADKTFPTPEEVKSWYVSVFGGASFHTGDVDYTNGITTVNTEFDAGFTFGGALGYKWHTLEVAGLIPRTELEFNYTKNSADAINFSGNGPGPEVVASGSGASAVGILGSVYVDAPKIFGHGITPYIGAGAGVNIVNHNLLYNGGLNLNDDGDTVFAWHVTGGVSYAVNSRVSLFTDVGFHQAVNTSSIRRNGAVTLAGAGGGRFEDDINSVVVKAGLSVGF